MTFDEHTNGQLRIGAQGDQIPLLPLPDNQIPASDGAELATPSLEGLTVTSGPLSKSRGYWARAENETHYARATGATEADALEMVAWESLSLPTPTEAAADAPQFRVWLESKQGSYWIPGTGTDEEDVRNNLTRTQRARVRAIKEVRRAP